MEQRPPCAAPRVPRSRRRPQGGVNAVNHAACRCARAKTGKVRARPTPEPPHERNDEDNALGPRIDARRAPRPERVTLSGRFVTVAPLAPEHAEPLYRRSHGPGREELWTYLFNGPFTTLAEFAADVDAKAKADRSAVFRRARQSRRPPGRLSEPHAHRPANRVIEVGGIMYTPLLQGTPGSTEAQYLFAAYVSTARLSSLRMEMQRPQRPLAPRGVAAGLLVRGRIPPAHDRERPQPRHRLVLDARSRMAGAARGVRGWLAPENFDAQGRQKRRLEDSAISPYLSERRTAVQERPDCGKVMLS